MTRIHDDLLTSEQIAAINRHQLMLKFLSRCLLILDKNSLGRKIFAIWKGIKRFSLKVPIRLIILRLLSIRCSLFKRNASFPNPHSLSPTAFEGKPHVLLFTSHLGPGGAERQIVLLAKQLKKLHIAVSLAVFSLEDDNNHYLHELESEDIPVHQLSIDSAYLEERIFELAKMGIDPQFFSIVPSCFKNEIISLTSFLILHPVDILHCYLDGMNIIGGWSGLISGTPLMRMSLRSLNPSLAPWFYRQNYTELYKPFLSHPRIQLEANCQAVADNYKDWLSDSKLEIEIVYNGLSSLHLSSQEKREIREKTRAKLGLHSNDFVILGVFRLSPEKDPESFISTLKTFSKRRPGARAFHVGIGAEGERIKELAEKELPTNFLTFLGRRSDIHELMLASDVLLTTSKVEGLSNVVMEAMAYDLPVVATNAGGTTELIRSEKEGLIAECGNIDHLSLNLIKLHDNKPLAKKYAQAAKKRIYALCSVERFSTNIRTNYEKMLSNFLLSHSKEKQQKRLLFKLFLELKKNTYPGYLEKKLLFAFSDTWLFQNLVIKPRLRILFKELMGYVPNIDSPQTFSEKIQWLKLYERNPLMTLCADKLLVREYVEKTIGNQYLIPLIGSWDSADQIDFSQLPQRFTLKVNWGSGYNIICKNKNELDMNETITQLRKWMQPHNNHFYNSYEWCYKDIKPAIVGEEFIEQADEQLLDYKVLCFHGEPKFIWVDIDRFGFHRRNFFTVNWERIDDFQLKYPKDLNIHIPRPKNLARMVSLARELCKPFKHVRVDFYNQNGKILFGELTFYSGSGMERFTPASLDYKLGEMIKLNYEQ